MPAVVVTGLAPAAHRSAPNALTSTSKHISRQGCAAQFCCCRPASKCTSEQHFDSAPPWQAEDLLREAMLLQAALDQGVPAAVLERLLPKRFKQYQKGISGRA